MSLGRLCADFCMAQALFWRGIGTCKTPWCEPTLFIFYETQTIFTYWDGLLVIRWCDKIEQFLLHIYSVGQER
jgi:hypothetical protein